AARGEGEGEGQERISTHRHTSEVMVRRSNMVPDTDSGQGNSVHRQRAAHAKNAPRRRLRWPLTVVACPKCKADVYVRVPPWTRETVVEWPDGRVFTLVECSRRHPVKVFAGDVKRAA